MAMGASSVSEYGGLPECAVSELVCDYYLVSVASEGTLELTKQQNN
jgi:hypothetical protein